jgi:hypothetical protein
LPKKVPQAVVLLPIFFSEVINNHTTTYQKFEKSLVFVFFIKISKKSLKIFDFFNDFYFLYTSPRPFSFNLETFLFQISNILVQKEPFWKIPSGFQDLTMNFLHLTNYCESYHFFNFLNLLFTGLKKNSLDFLHLKILADFVVFKIFIFTIYRSKFLFWISRI